LWVINISSGRNNKKLSSSSLLYVAKMLSDFTATSERDRHVSQNLKVRGNGDIIGEQEQMRRGNAKRKCSKM